MILICAWCQQEGKTEVLEKISDEGEDAISHGICHDHGLRLRQAFRQNHLYSPAASAPVYSA